MRKLKANELPRLIFHTDKGLKNEKKTCFFYLAEKNCCFCYFFLLIFITPTTKYISHVILTWIRRDVDGNQCKLLSIWHKIQHHRLERKREQRDSNNISLIYFLFLDNQWRHYFVGENVCDRKTCAQMIHRQLRTSFSQTNVCVRLKWQHPDP
jgi:hypothetical protein